MNELTEASMSLARPLSRRALLKWSGAALAGAATGPFVSTPARAQGFNWKRFQGKELFLLLTKHPWIEVLEKPRRPGGRRPDRRLHLLRGVLAGGAPARQAGGRRDVDPRLCLLLE